VIPAASMATAYANQRTFTYDVTLKHLGVAVATYRASITGLYVGTGIYEDAPSGEPSTVTLTQPAGGVLASWTADADKLVDIEFQRSYFEGLETGSETWITYGVEEAGLGAESHLLTQTWAEWKYRARVRYRTNGGVGAWTAFSNIVQVPAGAGGSVGGGAGGAPPIE
jgi:hypothetical protein